MSNIINIDTPLGKYYCYVRDGFWQSMEPTRMIMILKEILPFLDDPVYKFNTRCVIEQLYDKRKAEDERLIEKLRLRLREYYVESTG